MLALVVVSAALAALPVGLFFVNLRLFRRAPLLDATTAADPLPSVSILIPARDEERGIRACVEAALASRDVELEVIVLDDHSRDRTAAIVREIAASDGRLTLAAAPPLPPRWCGKQHACHVLANLARTDLLLFLDADVRLAPDAARRAVTFLQRSGAALVSGFPREETRSLLERTLLPLIHIVLLGYLPLTRMRRSTAAAYGAGCGQFFLARRDAYERAGGHASIRASLHDGLTLPRAFRAAGFATDLFDATDTASCRMYHGNRACWNGLLKNATEGMAGARTIVPWTLLLIGGHVLPFVLAAVTFVEGGPRAQWALAGIASAALLAMRAAAAVRFGQSWLGALLHPVAVLLLVLLQWEALLRSVAGCSLTWKGRAYVARAPVSG